MLRRQSASPTQFPNSWQRGRHSLGGDIRIFSGNLIDQNRVLTREGYAMPVCRNHDSQCQLWPQYFIMLVPKSCPVKVLLLKICEFCLICMYANPTIRSIRVA